jgi:hypothetical protein
VQVWIIDPSAGTKNFEALGVPVGDGTAILTIIDYEDYAPANGDIEVTTQNNETFFGFNPGNRRPYRCNPAEIGVR